MSAKFPRGGGEQTHSQPSVYKLHHVEVLFTGKFRQDKLNKQLLFLCVQKSLCKGPLSKRPNIGFQEQVSLNAGQKYFRMLQGKREHSTILWTFIKLPFVIRNLALSIFDWLFYTGFTLKHIS